MAQRPVIPPSPRPPTPLIDVDAVQVTAFGLADLLHPLHRGPSAWHAHAKHQLLYAESGTLHLQTAQGQWLLPPQRAAWIGAGIRHRVRPLSAVALRTVYVAPQWITGPDGLCVFAVTPVLREMILYAMRWGPDRPAKDATAEALFAALGLLSAEAAADRAPFCLPAPRSPELCRGVRHMLSHLGEPLEIGETARRAGLSLRTLARRFDAELEMSWRDFLHNARMLKAMELLVRNDATVTDTALAVGFESMGAFTRAFTRFAGESPRDFRKRGRAQGKAIELTRP